MAMRVLLDSHSLLWVLFDQKKLSRECLHVLRHQETIVYASIVSLWEIKTKNALGKLPYPDFSTENLVKAGCDILPLEPDHIEVYGQLPFHHRDPFDRMLVAQSAYEHTTLITSDSTLARYGIDILKAG